MSETKFRIEVENLFDCEKRKIKVKHNKEDGTAEGKEIDFPNGEVKQNRKTLELSYGDHLEIDLGDTEGKESKYWYIKLPLVADFRFLSERGEEVKVPLSYEVVRDESTGGRLEVRIPTEIDPTACKLLIAPPGKLKENYPTQNLTGELATDVELSPHDNISVGDNGEGIH
jgi:hypothetical protein